MKKYNSFELIKMLGFPKLSGRDSELKAAKIIQAELKKDGVEGIIEPFEVDNYNILNVELEVLEPFYQKLEVTGYGMSGSTAKEGLTAEMVYIESGYDVNYVDVKGKIALVNDWISLKIYRELLAKGAAGFITTSGTVYDDHSQTDLEPRTLREYHYRLGKIPGATIRIKDAEELLRKQAKTVRLTLQQQEGRSNSHNVVATIKGSTYPEEIIAITGHYDSVDFSPGAYDNASGSAAVLELMRYFLEHPPKRTLKFIWLGSEEPGLFGPYGYQESHPEEFKKIGFNVNIDMIGVVSGYNLAACASEMSLPHYLNYLAKIVGFPIKASQRIYPSDSTTFADLGVPAVTFARISPRGGAKFHTRRDTVEYLEPRLYYEFMEFIIIFTEKIANAVVMPVPKSIPNIIKEEIEYYKFRKDRPEENK